MAAGEAIVMQAPARPADLATGPEPVMPAAWRGVLEQCGAVFADGAVSGFGDFAAEPSPALFADVVADLSHFGLIAVEGPDARTFLASLFTGDVRLVSPSQGQFTSWCDGKGRILTTFWLFMRGETFYLLLPQELLASTLFRLRQFLLRSKARITDASGDFVRLGLAGPKLVNRLAEVLGGEAPLARGETRVLSDCTLVALGDSPHPRWLATGPAEALQKLWEKLLPGTVPVGAGAWSLLDILAGIPLLAPETSGEFIPQMLDLETLGGLCFTKGCYPGQEVVARLQYRGQLKRRMYLAYVEGDVPPPPGAKLYGPGTAESVGVVLAAAPLEPGKIALLAVVVIEHKAQGDIHLQDLQGPRLIFPEPDAPGQA